MTTLRTMMGDQAAAIPFRWTSGRLEVALITRRQGKHWIVPKGNIEPGETPRRSARREATEEAGLVGRIPLRPFGAYEQRMTEAFDLDEEQVRYARTIHSANNDLLTLINDILDLSKIEAGQVEISPEPVIVEEALR